MTEPRLSSAPANRFWRRAYFTPVSDALRGTLTGRLDVGAAIAEANLPAPVAAAIDMLVRKARLSRFARAELARDLIARSTYELAAGRAAQALASELASPDDAARDIRRARVKCRRGARWAASQAIVLADLPESIEALLEAVVGHSRLWPREKLDVARELVNHFADGLASGRSAEQLVADFGPPRQAAWLIRQAKIRNRSRAWHAYRLVKRTLLFVLAVGILTYAAWSVRFFVGQPNVQENYWTQINSGRRGPEAERAWPLYRAALIKLGTEDFAWMGTGNPWEEPPDWPAWDALLARHRPSFDLIHQAAGRKRLGYLLGDADERAELQAAAAQWLMPIGATEAENQELIGAPLGGMQALRTVALVLRMDALRAVRTGDSAAAETDLNSLLALSEQILDSRGFLVEQLIGYSFFHAVLDTMGEILRDYPQALSDEHLHALAHRLASFRDGVIDVDMQTEQAAFDDLLQRVFTDDGHGDGRITAAGLELIDGDHYFNGLKFSDSHDTRANAVLQAAMPGLAALVGSRKENRDLYRELLDATIAQHQGPPWTWDAAAIKQTGERLYRMGQRDRIRYVLVVMMLPAVQPMFDAVEYATQRRDATEVALALELWRRRHGAWPTALEKLVPTLLPAVPPDRADGQPLRYALRDGKPVLYSLGQDRDDDGGRSAGGTLRGRIIGFGPLDLNQLQMFFTSVDDDGDWILWPPAAPVFPPLDLQPDASQEQAEPG